MAKLKTTNVKGKMLVSDLGSTYDGSSPAITLAIGDNDTGFKAASDGNTEYWSNNVAQYNMKNVYHTGKKPSPADIGAAAASHGNHVPTTQTTNSGVFLRNDNTWATPNPDSIGSARGSRTNGHTGAAAGWYRIAQSGTDIGNNIGMFMIRAAAPNKHSSTILSCGITYAFRPTIQQLSHTQPGIAGISKARIVYPETYSGNKAYLEVYIEDDTPRSVDIQLFGSLGWSLLPPSTAGSVPSGYSNKEIIFATSKIVSDINGTINGFSIEKSVPSNAVFTDTKYSNATTSASGLMSNTDKGKLDGIAIGANNYSHPNDANTRHVTDTEKGNWNGAVTKANDWNSFKTNGGRISNLQIGNSSNNTNFDIATSRQVLALGSTNSSGRAKYVSVNAEQASFHPGENRSLHLGKSDCRWGSLYCGNIDTQGEITINGYGVKSSYINYSPYISNGGSYIGLGFGGNEATYPNENRIYLINIGFNHNPGGSKWYWSSFSIVLCIRCGYKDGKVKEFISYKHLNDTDNGYGCYPRSDVSIIWTDTGTNETALSSVGACELRINTRKSDPNDNQKIIDTLKVNVAKLYLL